MNAKHYVAALLFSLVTGCANRYRFETEAPNYAGQAELTVRVNKTELRELTMQLEHLAPPRRIDPSLKGYVAWISVPGHGIAKLGRIEYDEKKRKGSLVATSAFDKFEVLVTLESDLSSDTPSDRVVLRRVVGKG
ncbi:MAG: hypothetical protein IAG13_13370 [Deltaproteobacteria bacterium]|nr:hypothetical protein [Nannocystaceae bacterium]